MLCLFKSQPRPCPTLFVSPPHPCPHVLPTHFSVTFLWVRGKVAGCHVTMGTGSTEHLNYWERQLISIKAWLIFHRQHTVGKLAQSGSSPTRRSTRDGWRGVGGQKREQETERMRIAVVGQETGRWWVEMRWVRQQRGDRGAQGWRLDSGLGHLNRSLQQFMAQYPVYWVINISSTICNIITAHFVYLIWLVCFLSRCPLGTWRHHFGLWKFIMGISLYFWLLVN